MRHIRSFLPPTLLFAATALAADFWTAKPYGEWTDKDVQKMMSDSPWARPVRVQLTTQDAGGGEGAGNEEGGGPDEGAAKQTLHAIWNGKTMRMAQVRQRVLKGDTADEVRDKAFIESAPADSYVIVLQALGFRPLTKVSEADLQAATKLTVGKKDGRAIAPSKVVKPEEAKGFVAVFTFPKGDKPIVASDGQVSFETKVGKYPVAAKFSLADMMSGSDLDL